MGRSVMLGSGDGSRNPESFSPISALPFCCHNTSGSDRDHAMANQQCTVGALLGTSESLAGLAEASYLTGESLLRSLWG